MWRGLATAQGATVAADTSSVYVLGDDNNFYALDAATGRQKWMVAFARGSGSCQSVPVVRDGVVYVTGSVLRKPADAYQPASYYRHLFALDAVTGKERWRYPSTPAGNNGVCFTQPVVTDDTFFAVDTVTLYAVNLSTGRDRWTPVEVRRPVDGRERSVEVGGLVDAGSVLIGLTRSHLIAFDKASGRTAWEIPGQYRETSPSTAVAGNVLYFQGHPGAPPAAEVQDRIVYSGGKPVVQAAALPPGKLNALDLDTRKILWSFSRPSPEPNWPFGFVSPDGNGLWVDSYQALMKLQ
jgi:outer membrane protein assembly factor BamB